MLIAAMLTGAAVLAGIIGPTVAWVAAAATFVTEGGLAALVFLSAGGYGYLVIRRMAPSSAPAGLRVFSACMLGLWMLSTLMLAAGSLFHDLLKPYVWWPIIGLGVLAAAIQARHTLSNWRPAPQTDGRALLWVLLAAAGTRLLVRGA